MKKEIKFLLATIMMFVGITAQAATITVTWTAADIKNATGDTFTINGVTLAAGHMDHFTPFIYNGGTFTTTLGNFTKIEISADYAGDVSGTGWSNDGWQSATWTGNAASVSFSDDIWGGGMTCDGDNLTIVFTIEEPDAVNLTLDEATDNSTTLTTNDGKKANVTLTRTLQTSGWNTFCVPFSTSIPSGWTVKELTTSSFNSSTGALSLTFGNATSIVAGTPYLVKVTSNVVNPTFDGVTISKDTAPVSTTAIDFVPTLGLTEITGDANDVLFLSSGNKLLHPSSLPANMKGFRAYLLLKGEAALARSFSMDFGDGETTGIITIENGQSATSKAIYDLQGRRVNGTAQKGMYIVNGKKTVIK